MEDRRRGTDLGLADTHIIAAIVVDPKNPDVVLVAAPGNASSGSSRGVFKSTDGGKTWTKTLSRDGVGSSSLAVDPATPNIIYAPLTVAVSGGRGAPPAPPSGPTLYRSTDEGSTWTPVGGKDLPGSPIPKIGVAVGGGTGGRRVFVIMREGLYRSDDAGETWQRPNTDARIVAGGVVTDPGNAEVLYVTQTSMYRSTDGGRTFEAFAGAPSGDDIRLLWVDPGNSRRLLAGVDQGAIVSVNGGSTWSSWYNQPTGQLYHVSTDTAVPYRVYAAQQDSGTVAVPSRSDFGEISFRDWYSTGGFEFGYIAADPLDPGTVFSAGWYGAVVRFDRRTGQIAHVFARGTKYRGAANAPMAFSPHDPHALYLGEQYLLKTTDAGMHWTPVSDELTAPGPGVINTFSLSTVKAGLIWVGTSNGRVKITEDDGAAWHDVSPQGFSGAVDIIQASHKSPDTAYFCANPGGKPAIYRTHDRGKTWQNISGGIPDDAIVRVIREDPERQGLLYAGTESSVWTSFDEGDHWQSLQLNLPTTSMRDMEVHGDDLVLATYGRGLWILDDISPLRQMSAQIAWSSVHLFKPAGTIRFHWDVNEDTPLPIETPTSPNPMEGAIVDYYLKAAPSGEIALTIADAKGEVVRRYSSVPPPAPALKANVPSYWFAPPDALPKAAGMNRFAWNLRYESPKILPFGYFGGLLNYIEYTLAEHAIPGRTPAVQPEGPLALPSSYTVTLTVDGRSYTQPLTVSPDPRVKATHADLAAQLAIAKQITGWMERSYDGYYQAGALRKQLADQIKALAANPGRAAAMKAMTALDAAVAPIENVAAGSFGIVNRDLTRVFAMLTSGDAAPAAVIEDTAREACQALAKTIDAWTATAAKARVVDAGLGGHLLTLPTAGATLRAPECGTPR